MSGDTLMPFVGGGTTRWMSPELLAPEQFGVPQSEGDRPTRQSDCYALGMVIYEVGTFGHHNSILLVLKIPSSALLTGKVRNAGCSAFTKLNFQKA